MHAILDPSRREVLRAVAECAVPRARRFGDEQWARAVDVVEEALSRRSSGVRRQIRVFLTLLDWLPALRWGRRYRRLDHGRRVRVLEALQDAPLLLLRRGAWGVRTLAFMGCYGLPEVRREIGYRAHPQGWAARRARTGETGGAEPEGPEPGPEIQL